MLSLPLAKLSVARDAEPHEQHFVWQHDTADLTLVLDACSAPGSAQRLKIFQGTQVRHLIELEHLIRKGDAMMSATQEAGRQLKADQLPVSAIVRCPLLAIRWLLPSMKVRRAQLRFQSNEDYHVAYTRLHHMGLRMNSTRDTQAPTHPRTPSPARSSTAHATSAPEPCSNALTESLSCPPSRLADIASRPYTATNPPKAVVSYVQEAAHIRPASALGDQRKETARLHHTLSGPLAPPFYFPRPKSATSDTLGQPCDAYQSQSLDNPVLMINHSDAELGNDMSSQRPMTADTLLPPRRELPFQRSSLSSSPQSDNGRSNSRPSTGLMGPPPLPCRVTSLRPASSRAAGSEATLSPLSQPIGKVTRTDQFRLPAPAQPQSDKSVEQRYLVTENMESLRTFSSPVSLPTLRETSGAYSVLNPQASNSGNRETGQGSIQSPGSLQTSLVTTSDPLTTSQAARFESDHLDRLAGYDRQPEDGRRAALNEFIYLHLESDEFLALIEDMETCWARIAIGM
ncbi:hypothetical protein ACN47E_003886 [Coniothyrium glycines]